MTESKRLSVVGLILDMMILCVVLLDWYCDLAGGVMSYRRITILDLSPFLLQAIILIFQSGLFLWICAGTVYKFETAIIKFQASLG